MSRPSVTMMVFSKQFSARFLVFLLLAGLGRSSHHAPDAEDRNDKSSSSSSQFSLRGPSARRLQEQRRTQSGVPIDLKPIRYCESKGRRWGFWTFCSSHGYPHGEFWNNAGAAGLNEDDALFATMGSVPSPSDIEYIAIFSSGEEIDDDNVVSGAMADSEWDTYQNPSQPRTVDGRSVAAQFYDDEVRFLPRSKTLYLTVWDPEFNHIDSLRSKTNMLEGYAQYLTSKVNWSNIKGVVLSGSSRGGCFAFRLGEYLRINNAPPTTGFAIAALDAVCNVAQNEFGVTSSTLENPLPLAKKDSESFVVDINSQYPSGTRSQHCIWHFTIGEPAYYAELNYHGFSHTGCDSVDGCTLLDENGDVYYEQQWGDMSHGKSTKDYVYSSETVDPILSHLDDCKDRFGWNQV
uniref:Feruloyl esterase n=1 Tax=Grammatophora oceanica TaxID=210454 RepID=A0A7S1VLL4_9STRA|mmetsp:Transcript_49979/g.74584  ORF Transcript_49979/g.74584 Transcript_49979/m.74584 type:complete len:405 (+) Transcript_49979:379-1593(+)|eukprot:CAMPEP_0194037584 /NCGR_PEP_ID=MMETSP0009_2-20130614/9915_1 /TAXON_ID=210454 /ORGANISM="Grammatophora oceanica, Strain CCMP 410" /LENGTH=404 /DNA_ID=CAMNT_0038679805 /DNA_START=356 /DNA_END=1570 /DNA_ORIENTATION=+